MSIKITKEEYVAEAGFPCHIVIEHYHNHPIKSLEVLSFKAISSDALSKINAFFETGCTPSSAYREFLCSLRKNCENELDFHIKKVDRSITPRRRDFNTLYKKYCLENFGGKDCAEMFEKLGEKIEQFLQMEPESRIEYSTYNTDEDSPFILAIVTPLMQRVHSMVSHISMIYLHSFS